MKSAGTALSDKIQNLEIDQRGVGRKGKSVGTLLLSVATVP